MIGYFVFNCIFQLLLLSTFVQNAKRASEAAAPLAAWVTANVKFAGIIEKIEPLEREQAELQK